MQVEAYGRRDVGRKRERNEDNLAVTFVHGGARPVGVFVVADGVGGRASGHLASQMFCDRVIEGLANETGLAGYTVAQDRELRQGVLDRLSARAVEAGAAIYDRQAHDDRIGGMSTTGVVLVTVEQGAFLAHAGDSRAYLLRGDRVFRLTEDHTLGNEMRKRGLIDAADLAGSPVSQVLSRAFGTSPRTEVDTLYVKLEPGDRFVLCSDGAHRYLRGAELLEMSQRVGDREAFVAALVDECNRRGGEDNIAAVAVDVVGDVARARGRHPRVGLRTQIDFMHALFLFRDLDEQELMRLGRICHRKVVQAGTSVICEGEAGDDFYLVLAGRAEVTTGGTRLVTVNPGEHFGEMALLDEPSRSADVRALTEMVLMSIGRADFDRLLREDPTLGNKVLFNLLRFMARRVRSLTTNVRDLSGPPR